MISIAIDKSLKELWPKSTLGCIQCKVFVEKSSKELLEELYAQCRTIQDNYEKPSDLPKREKIADTRSAYKAFGKEPSRYRSSAEAMCRRLLQGKELYHINNVVECNNLFSISSGYSLGVYDVDKTEGTVIWRVAGKGSHYQGIGKDQINVEFLPVFCDEQGPFGNPTSDSVRTRVTEKTTEILMVIFGFSGIDSMEEDVKKLWGLLEKYCYGREVEMAVIQ